MTVFLKLKDGDDFRDVAALVPDEPLSIGRTDECDVSFPDDMQMSGHHASVELQHNHECLVRDLGSSNGTRLNDEPVDVATVTTSDVIRCGATEFAVEWYAESPPVDVGNDSRSESPGTTTPIASATASKSQPTVSPGESQTPTSKYPQPAEPGEHLDRVSGFIEESAERIIKRFELPPDTFPIGPEHNEPPEIFVQRLLDTGERNASLTFLAYALPRRCAVWWLVECIRHAGNPKFEGEGPMLQATEQWVLNPTVESRRRAMKLAEQLDMKTPAAWSGAAAFWSDGSMAPPDCPSIPPADDLTGKAVAGGVILATVIHEPQNAMRKQEAFTEIGLKIAAGEIRWEGK